MAGQMDVRKLLRMFPGVTLPGSFENDPTTYTLIHVDCCYLSNNSTHDVKFILQNDPKINCCFQIMYKVLNSKTRIRAKIFFPLDKPCTNLKYKASLYFMTSASDSNFTFLEDIYMENITNSSIFYFSLPTPDFEERHCYLYLEISRKDNYLTPMEVKSPKSEMIKDLSLLFKNKCFTDVKIICQNQEFSAHKVLLIARSPVFHVMFEHEMKESQTNEIRITDLEPEILEHLLKFIYTDTVEDLKEGQAEKLLAAANKYALDNLKLICMKEIAKSVKDIQKSFDVLAIAEHYNVPGFRDTFLDFAVKNANKP